jgi:hypothetical protein
MEAAWLTALAVVPCLCNPYVENNFGPEKAALLHGLSLLTAGAWLVLLATTWRKGQSTRQIAPQAPPSSGRGAGGEGEFSHPLPTGEGELSTPAGTQSGSIWIHACVWTLLALVIGYVVSTCFSIVPRQSIWGDIQTRAGTCTFLAYVVFFAAIATNLRSGAQLERLVSAALTGSLAVALYAVLQKLRLDPIDWPTMTSLLGHPLYVAAYLGMVFPLTLWRIATLLPRPNSRASSLSAQPVSAVGSDRRLRAFSLGYYASLAVLQLLAVALTSERAPVLGLLIAMVCFFVLASATWNLRRLLFGTFAVAGAAVAFLVLLNIPGGPLQPLRSWRLLDRFAHGLFSAREGTGFFRADLWKECPKLMLSSEPVRRPDGANDTLGPARFWLGYGPESTTGILAQRYTVPHSNATLEDRFHNRVWDLWESVGALGITAFLAFFVALFGCGLCQLGLISRRGDSFRFCLLVLGCSLLGAIVLSLWQGYGFCGLGLQLGMAVGCVIYPLTRLRREAQSPKPGTPTQPQLLKPIQSDNPVSSKPFFSKASDLFWLPDFGSQIFPSALLTIALLTACLMHLVETGFAFPTASTATLFWSFAALLLASQRLAATAPARTGQPTQLPQADPVVPSSAAAPAPAQSKSQDPKQAAKKQRQRMQPPAPVPVQRPKVNPFQAALFPAGLITMLLVPLINLFLLRYTHEPLSSSDFLAYAFQATRSASSAGNGAPGFLFVLWLGSAWLLAGPRFDSPPSPWVGRFFATMLLSGGVSSIYALWNAARLSAIGPLPQRDAQAWSLLSQAHGYDVLYWGSMALILALVLLCGIACSGLALGQLRRFSTAGLIIGLGTFVAVGAVAMDVPAGRAEISLRWAEVLNGQKVWPAVHEVFDHAIQFSPNQFTYHSKLAQALREQAESGRDPSAWAQAERVLVVAKSVPGYNRRLWHLGQLYLAWAEREKDSGRRLDLAQKAKSSLEAALLWEPKCAPIWSDYAYINFAFLHNEEEGLRLNQKAFELDPYSEEANGRFADFYASKSAQAPDADSRRSFAAKAVKFYNEAAGNTRTPFPYLMSSGSLLLSLQQWPKAIERFQLARDAADDLQAAQVEEMLAQAYFGASNQPAALEHLHYALDRATPDKRPALLDLEKRISAAHPSP